MSVIDSAGLYFDRLVGVFSPVRQAKKSQYAAAKEDRLTGITTAFPLAA